jgi:hypothetical protein
VYHDGSGENGRRLACAEQGLDGLDLKTIVFKWKNPESRWRTLWSHPWSVQPVEQLQH